MARGCPAWHLGKPLELVMATGRQDLEIMGWHGFLTQEDIQKQEHLGARSGMEQHMHINIRLYIYI